MTVCDLFEPASLNGQLCYSLDVGKLKGWHSNEPGKANGLFLLLDPSSFAFNSEVPKISIHTLARFTTFGAGSFGMSALKKMTGTKSFLQLPDQDKKCSVHDREECQTQKYLDAAQKYCNCTPWTLGNKNGNEQVSSNSMNVSEFAGRPILWPG